jgi:hypothetical protein
VTRGRLFFVCGTNIAERSPSCMRHMLHKTLNEMCWPPCAGGVVRLPVRVRRPAAGAGHRRGEAVPCGAAACHERGAGQRARRCARGSHTYPPACKKQKAARSHGAPVALGSHHPPAQPAACWHTHGDPNCVLPHDMPAFSHPPDRAAWCAQTMARARPSGRGRRSCRRPSCWTSRALWRPSPS